MKTKTATKLFKSLTINPIRKNYPLGSDHYTPKIRSVINKLSTVNTI